MSTWAPGPSSGQCSGDSLAAEQVPHSQAHGSVPPFCPVALRVRDSEENGP